MHKKSNNIDGDKSKLLTGSEQEQEEHQVRDDDEKRGALCRWKQRQQCFSWKKQEEVHLREASSSTGRDHEVEASSRIN